MSPRVLLVVLMVLGSWLISACESSASLAAAPGSPPPPSMIQASPVAVHTPSGIFISTSVRPTASPTRHAATLEAGALVVTVQGHVYDAENNQHLNDAIIAWQFLALDWQRYNGEVQVSADGLYHLQLPIRATDEVILTTRASGYLPSTARLTGKQLNRYGTRLNFGLVTANGPAPTVPGALGIIQLSGTVYNAVRGLLDPIANARVTVVDRSLVRPGLPIDCATSITGTFAIPVALHTTDQLDVTISASGYQTVTLTRNASDLAQKPQLLIGLRPTSNK